MGPGVSPLLVRLEGLPWTVRIARLAHFVCLFHHLFSHIWFINDHGFCHSPSVYSSIQNIQYFCLCSWLDLYNGIARIIRKK